MAAGFDIGVYVFAFILGSAIGSFLNVCIYRMPREESIVSPASRCPSCHTPIRPADNIPIIGYLRLHGRCRSCRAPISIRYPLVEAVTGLAAIASIMMLGPNVEGIAYFLLFILLFTASMIDIEHQIIPNLITYPGIVLAFCLSFIRSDMSWLDSLIGVGVGGGALLTLRQIGQWVFKKESMGLGDIKLIVMIGAFLGWRAALGAIFLGSILGTLYGIPILIQESRTGERGTHVIPFGPFLSGGGLLAAVLLKMPWLLSWFYFPV